MREPGTYLVAGTPLFWAGSQLGRRHCLFKDAAFSLKEVAAWLKLHALYATQISSILALDGVYSVENAREFRPLEVGLL